MEQGTFWTRLGQWFKTGSALRTFGEEPPNYGDDALRRGDLSGGTAASPERASTHEVQRLESRYQQVAGLVDSIHRHLQSQDERTRQMADALSNLAGTIARLPVAAETQQQQLSAIVGQLEVSNARAARWEEAISQIPGFAEAHRQTLHVITEQIDATQGTQKHLVQSIDGFRTAVTSLSQATTTSAEVFKGIHQSASDRDERLLQVLTEQNRRFARLFVTAIVFAAVFTVVSIGIAVLK